MLCRGALSSVGRTLVSKIRCRGFKSFRARFSFLRGFIVILNSWNLILQNIYKKGLTVLKGFQQGIVRIINIKNSIAIKKIRISKFII